MTTRITRKYCRVFLSFFLSSGLSQATSSAVEYLITDNQTTKAAVTTLNFSANSGIQSSNLLYVYASYTAAEATTYTGIQSANLQISSSSPATAYISPASNFTVNDTAIGNGTFGQADANGFGFDSITSNYTGGTGSSTQATASYVVNGGFNWAMTNAPPGTYYLLLGSTTFSIDTSQTGTSSLVSVNTDGTSWSMAGGTALNPTAATFSVNVAVPEPSTYATAALACAALGGVALKRRRKAEKVAVA